jgi:hypothetical protein
MANVTATLTADSVEWYTPPDILEPARRTLGSIELDPASSIRANEMVGAERFYTVEDDAFTKDWSAKTIFLNPPSPPKRWWMKLLQQVDGGHCSGIFIAYSIEALQQIQLWTPGRLSLFCIPRRRIPYLCTAESAANKLAKKLFKEGADEPKRADLSKLLRLQALPPDELIPGDQPAHASAILGLNVAPDKFQSEFSIVGDVFESRNI